MAKPKACQTPNAEMTPISSNPANKPELERPFKAERCPGEPGSFCGPWVGPVTAPLRVGLQQEGAGGTPPCRREGRRGLASGSSPRASVRTRRLAARLSRGARRAERQRCRGQEPRGSPGAGSVSAPAACLVGVWGLAAGDGAPRWVQLWAPQTTTCTGEATCFPEAG